MRAVERIWSAVFAGSALALVPALCSASEYIDAGMTFYDAGDYKKAAQYFYTFAKKSPHDAEARYYLANSLVKLGRMQEAFVQYQAAIALKSDSEVADYCRQALLVFHGENAETVTKKDHDDLVSSTKPRLKDDAQDDEEEAKRAARAVDAQTAGKEAEITEEGDVLVKRIMHETAEKVALLEKEKQSEITLATGGYRPASRDEIVKGIELDYQKRIESLNTEAKHRSDQILADCKARISSLENTANNASQSMINKGHKSTVRPVPLASNLHVHNYETEQEPSGGLIPSVAQPAKSLSAPAKNESAKKK